MSHDHIIHQGREMPSANICDALCDLVPFAQFKKREKHQSYIEENQQNREAGCISLFLIITDAFFILFLFQVCQLNRKYIVAYENISGKATCFLGLWFFCFYWYQL